MDCGIYGEAVVEAGKATRNGDVLQSNQITLKAMRLERNGQTGKEFSLLVASVIRALSQRNAGLSMITRTEGVEDWSWAGIVTARRIK